MDANKYNKVYNRLTEHLQESLNNSKIGDWFIIAVNGSYNYDLDTKKSDIDSKLLVIPSLKQLIFNNPLNYIHHMSDNDEHVEIKDIRLYFNTMMKQNINFIETLYAQTIIVNEIYQEEFDNLIKMRDVISYSNPIATIKCIQGMMHDKARLMIIPSPSRKLDIEKYGYDRKSLHHLFRIYLFGIRYMNGVDYQECLLNNEIPAAKDYLKEIKIYGAGLDKAAAIENANNILNIFDKKVEEYINIINSREINNKLANINKQSVDILNDISFNIIKKKVWREFYG